MCLPDLAKKGEIFVLIDESCSECPPGEYSLINPMEDQIGNQGCKLCPENANCYGGDSIMPHKGFWRFDSNSSLIIECVAEDSCLGDSETKVSFTKQEGKL